MIKIFRRVCLSALLTVCACLASCHHKGIPSYVIQEQQMAEILQDAYLLEGFFSVESNFHYDTLQPEVMASYDSLFARHQVTRHDFDTSIAWYVRHPEIYKRVHDSVVARLDRQIVMGEEQPVPDDKLEKDMSSDVSSEDIEIDF